MIIAIKAVVNYQIIVDSIDNVNKNIEKTNEHTDYINNYLTPYLESDYAPYFLAHENNQLFPGEIIVKINVVESGAIIATWQKNTLVGTSSLSLLPSQSRKRFLENLVNDIVWMR